LRQRDDVAVAAIPQLEQPSTNARLRRMTRVACRGLLGLRQNGGVPALDALAQLPAFIQRLKEFRPCYGISASLNLNSSCVDRETVAGNDRSADNAFAPDHSHFDCVAGSGIDKKRDYSACRKQDLLDRGATAVNVFSLLQLDRFKRKQK